MRERIARLAGHSVVYGLGGLVSRVLAVLFLPLYTRYLSPHDYGSIETVVALSAMLVTILRFGIPSAFFRFYFDAEGGRQRLRLIRTSFWFTMVVATATLAAGVAASTPIARVLLGSGSDAHIVDAGFVGLWAQMNYEQLTALFRVEQRSLAFVCASLANVAVTVAATLVLVVALHAGPVGVLVGNFLGTLTVYAVLVAYRRDQLGLEFDRPLLRAMNRFGLPLVPAALALWVINFADRFFLVVLSGQREVGLYSVGVRMSSGILLLIAAFGTAWPAFAYSLSDDEEARQTYGHVLTYLLLVCSWLALATSALAPFLVRLLTTTPFYSSARVVAPLAFSLVAYAGYTVVVIGLGRARRTSTNWIVTGAAALVNTAVNVALIPDYGMMGAAIATLAAYAVLFLVMAWHVERVYPVAYQWGPVLQVVGAAAVLTVADRLAHPPLAVALAVVAIYPFALFAAGFRLGPLGLRRNTQLSRPI